MNQELVTIENMITQISEISIEDQDAFESIINETKFKRFVQGVLVIMRIVEL